MLYLNNERCKHGIRLPHYCDDCELESHAMRNHPGKMTERKAVQVLIATTRDFLIGSGRGISQELSDMRRERIKEAMRKLWHKAYNFEPSDNDLS